MGAGKPSQPFVPGASLGKADVRFKGLLAALTEAQQQNPIPKGLRLELVFCLGNCKFGMILYKV